MKDEQIKQNAETAYPGFEDLQTVYIEGAHSRDEEIEELKEEIESLKENEKELFEGFKKRGTKLGELMKENVKLLNPWISVNEKLPEEGSDNISIPVAAITNKGYWFKGQYDFNNKDWFFSEDPDHLDFETDEFVTHWMPIPELNKGE